MITKVCEICGKEYQIKPYRKEKSHFCSRECQGLHTQREVLSKVDKSYMNGNQLRKGLKPTNGFQLGHTPWNKGLLGIHLSPNTEFVRGNNSSKNLPIGSTTIRTRRDERETPRQFIKIANPDIWIPYAIYLIREANIEIPTGYVVHHKNGNSLDDRLENLEVLSRAEHIEVHRPYFDRLNNIQANGQISLFTE